MKKRQHIIIVGKSGAGKSMVASNISASLAEAGRRVLQIGYGLSRDSTATLQGGREQMVVEVGREASVVDGVSVGFNGVLCIETGHLQPSTIKVVLRVVERKIEESDPEFVLHDIAWENYGERLMHPFGRDGAKVVLVLSSEFSTIHAANSILRTLGGYPHGQEVHLVGVIANGLPAPFSESMVTDFSERVGARMLGVVPHSLLVLMSELYGTTVLESASQSQHAHIYRKLARAVVKAEKSALSRFLSAEELRDWGRKWGGIIHELENGVIRDGACI